jgi:hypothetical protein
VGRLPADTATAGLSGHSLDDPLLSKVWRGVFAIALQRGALFEIFQTSHESEKVLAR